MKLKKSNNEIEEQYLSSERKRDARNTKSTTPAGAAGPLLELGVGGSDSSGWVWWICFVLGILFQYIFPPLCGD